MYSVEFNALNQTMQELEQSASKYTSRILKIGGVYLVAQTAFISRLVWFYAGWDIMEPFTFLVTLTTMIGGFGYFARHKLDYTYENLGRYLTYATTPQRLLICCRSSRKLDKLVASSGFNSDRYAELKNALAQK
jgi:hypothetical protein